MGHEIYTFVATHSDSKIEFKIIADQAVVAWAAAAAYVARFTFACKKIELKGTEKPTLDNLTEVIGFNKITGLNPQTPA